MKVLPLVELGKRIMKFRDQGGVTKKERGWSREDFAALIGICPSYLAEIEPGQKEAGWMILGSICEVLRCTPNDLMDGIPGCCAEVHRRHEELSKRHSDSCECSMGPMVAGRKAAGL